MTRKQLFEAVIANKYILARDKYSGILIGYNSSIVKSKLAMRFPIDDTETNFQSYMPCNFMEYISNKAAFI